MKKNLRGNTTVQRIIMRFSLTVCILFTLAQLLTAGNSTGQSLENARVTLSIADKPFEKIISEIETQTKLRFVYNPDETGKRLGNEYFKNVKVITVLHTLGYEAYSEGNYVIVKKITAKKPVTKDHAKPGTLTGQVVDETGQGLPGTTVLVKNTTVNTVTDVEGKYTARLESGTYEVEFRFMGYQTQVIQGVTITDNELTSLNISMKVEVAQLGEVVITESFEKASTEGLLVRQKNNAGISDGISAEQISRTPDKNIAESLKRISGLSSLDNKYVVVRGLSERYNQAMMNGQMMPSTELNRKNFSYDIIPTSMVDNIVVTKAFTPDQSAEFGGGVVQINTKDIPTENFLSASFGVTANDKTTGKAFRSPGINNKAYAGGISNDRKLFGTLNWKSRDEIVNSGNFTEQSVERFILNDASAFSNNWGLHTYTPAPTYNGQLSVGRVIPLEGDQTLGVIASASYRNTWQTQDMRMSRDGYMPADALEEKAGFTGKRYGFVTNLGGIAGVGYRKGGHTMAVQTIYLRTFDRQFVLGTGFSDITDGNSAVSYYDLLTVTNLWQSQFKSEHVLGSRGAKLQAALSYTRLDRLKPDNHQFTSTYVGEGADDPGNPDSDFSIMAPKSSAIDQGAARWWSRALENNLAWNIDFTQPFAFNVGTLRVNNSFKAGYAGWSKDRLFWVLLTGSKNFNQGEPEPLSELFDPAGGGEIYASQFGDDFQRKASLHAGYLMLDNKIGKKLRLVWGARAEYYNLNGANAILDAFVRNQKSSNNDLTDYSDLYNREPDWNFFPSVNMTYSLTRKMNLRLAYARSIIRPDLRETAYFREYDFELGGSYWSQSPIISTKITHVDFRYEWYPSAGEIMSFSLFYKKMLYPMEIFALPNRLFELRNDKDAINKGIEVELRKTLAFTGLPVLKNITLSGNFTRLFATVRTMDIDYNGLDANNPNKLYVVEIISPEEKRPQSGASNFMYNAGVYYDSKLLSVSLSYNQISNRFYRVGDSDVGSLYEQPMKSLDAQVAVKVLKDKGSVKLNIGNLLGSKYIIYLNRYDGNGVTPLDGHEPSAKELLYQKSTDVIDYEASPGRTYTLGFSYNF